MASQPTISVAIIARDEEAVIGRCVSQLVGAVDEVIVADTGSVDPTRAIARAHGARVVEYPWHDDFAAARQFAFDQATTDWVCWFDADDVIADPASIRGSIDAAGNHSGAIAWRYVLNRDEAGEPGFTYWRERCVRPNHGFRWAGRVHEVLVGPPDHATRYDESVVIDHQPDATKAATKSGRNLRILAREYEDKQGEVEARHLFYLAREYLDHGEVATGRRILTEYLAVAHWRDERYVALMQLAKLQTDAEEWDDAVGTSLRAIQEWPLRPEAYFALARIAYLRRLWSEVIHWVEAGRRLPLPDTVLFVDLPAIKSGWIIYYTNALYWQGRLAEAATWTERGLAAEPDNAWHLANRDLFSRILAAGQVPLTRTVAPVLPVYVVIPIQDRVEQTSALLDQLSLPPDQVYLIDYGSTGLASDVFASRARLIPAGERPISDLWNIGFDAIAASQTGPYNVAVVRPNLRVGPEFLPGLANALRARASRLIAYPDSDGSLPSGWIDPLGQMSTAAFMVRGEAGLRAGGQLDAALASDDLARQARTMGDVVRVGGLSIDA